MEKMFVGQVTQKLVLKYQDSFVILRDKDGDKWILPGGRLNVGETTGKGVLREIREELSVEGRIENIISVDAYHSPSEKPSKLFVFCLATILPNQKIVLKNEIVDIAYISKKDELDKYPMYKNQQDVLEKFLS